jgi:hypothetical protein
MALQSLGGFLAEAHLARPPVLGCSDDAFRDRMANHDAAGIEIHVLPLQGEQFADA